MVLFLRDDVVTHAGLYWKQRQQVAAPFELDVEFDSINGFYRVAASVQLHYMPMERAEGDEELSLVRITESGVTVVFDAEGALSQAVSEPAL